MSVWFYYIGSTDNVGIENVMFYNFNPSTHKLGVKYFSGEVEIFENIDYISNVYVEGMDHSQHEIILI